MRSANHPEENECGREEQSPASTRQRSIRAFYFPHRVTGKLPTMAGLEHSEKARPRPNRIRRTQCHQWCSATIGVTVGVIVIIGVMGPTAFLTALSRVTCPIQYRVSGDCVILGPPPARFDQQAVLFEPTTVRSLSTNVTFSEISSGDGYGPAYLLNGLTNEGFWFQIGTAYN